MAKLLYNLLILLFASYVVLLYLAGKLRFYIHPRYELFTFAGAIIALIITSIFLVHMAYGLTGKIKISDLKRELLNFNFARKFILLVLPLLLGAALPIKPLSSATASQRDLDLNSLAGREASTIDIFAADTKQYTLGEWVIALNSEPDLDDYVGKEVAVDGFVYDREGLPPGMFLLSRFAITCCAVDASPVGLVVDYDWEGKYQPDEWLKVKGRFSKQTIAGSESLVIEAQEVAKIKIPDNPYVY